MRGQELYEIWAPSGASWSPWVSPALFAQIECVGGATASVTPGAQPKWVEKLSPDTAIIVDLPGSEAVRLALVLARHGYRAVPIINASPGPAGVQFDAQALPGSTALQSIVALDMTAVVREICSGTGLLQTLALDAEAQPVFILDANRLQGTNPIRENMFDNRWMVFPQDFPSARFLAQKGIKRALVVQRRKGQPFEDLSHVLLRWQEGGIEILTVSVQDEGEVSRTMITRPSRFKASWYRALAILGFRRSGVGGFGSFIPGTSASG
jgi:hypothetical protein